MEKQWFKKPRAAMDWPMNDPTWSEYDTSRAWGRGTGKCTVMLNFSGSEKVSNWELESDEAWDQWLDNDHFLFRQGPKAGLGIILTDRSEEHDDIHNRGILNYVPFSRRILMRLVEALPIHRDTAEMIRETGDGRFVDIDLTETAWNAFFYCCRTTNIRPGDLAVSSVFYPKSGFTAAVVFGCSQSVKEEIAERMSRLENSTSHPLVIMGMIAEIELKRQDDMVGSHVADLLQRMADLTNYEQISTTSKVRKDHYSVASWIGITSLRNSLQTWQVQISRMIEHLDHLQVMFEADFSRLHNDNSSVTVGQGWQRHGAKTGRRMKRRLREIIHEYDKYIQHCNMSIEGMSLATQMSWNQISYQDTQTNIRIASDAKQDSSHMKIIATLTMVFLPATFVSSVFSMSFFDWDPPEGKQIVSHYAWIYPVIVAAITVVVLGVWYPFTKRVKSKHGYVLPSV